MRARKYRVCLVLSPEGKLFLLHFAMNIIQVFERTGKKIGEFSRLLPFKPMLPRLEEQKSLEEGIISMRASLDFVIAAARFGPDGNLYILTNTESFSERMKKEKNVGPGNLPPDPMRIDVIDPKTYKVVHTIACDPGTKVFGILDKNRLVYIHEDSEGELILKCIEY
jgi:hypothetical protein